MEDDQEMTARRISLTLLLILGASALGVVAFTSPNPAPVARQAVDFAPLMSRFEDLAKRIDDVVEQVRALDLRATVGDRQILAEQPKSTTLPAGGEALPIQACTHEVRRDAPQDWRALDALAALAEVDYEWARKSVWLVTFPELVRRFGVPDRMEGDQGEVYVYYDRLGPDGQPSAGVLFVVIGGYVTLVDPYR